MIACAKYCLNKSSCFAGGISAQTLQCDQGTVGNGILGEECCAYLQPSGVIPCCRDTGSADLCPCAAQHLCYGHLHRGALNLHQV